MAHCTTANQQSGGIPASPAGDSSTQHRIDIPMTATHQHLIGSIFSLYDEIALAGFRSVEAEVKADGTTVTEVDREASLLVTERLRSATPLYGIVSEEEAEPYLPQAEWQWVVDPLDGTSSFARGYPVWGLGIGLLRNGRPEEGYFRCPAIGETYVFANGAYQLNGAPIADLVSEPRAHTLNCLVDSGLHEWLPSFGSLAGLKLRGFGSTLHHLISVGMGRSELAITGRCYIWDMAAALPLLHSRGMMLRHADGTALDFSALTYANGYRLPAPLIVGEPRRVERFLDSIR